MNGFIFKIFLFFVFVLSDSIVPIIAQTSSVSRTNQMEPQHYVKDSLHWDMKKLDTARDSVYLQQIERNVILELNMARTNPKKYAELYIKPMLSKFDGTVYKSNDDRWMQTKEGSKAVEECIKELNSATPCLIIYPNKKLYKMSKYHADLQGKTEQIGHNCPNGETFIQRIKKFKIPYYCCAENIDYGQNSAREIVVSLLVDDGVPSRGHRTNILNNFYNKIGVYYGTHKKYGYMCVMDFVGYND